MTFFWRLMSRLCYRKIRTSDLMDSRLRALMGLIDGTVAVRLELKILFFKNLF